MTGDRIGLRDDPEEAVLTLLEERERARGQGDNRSPRELFREHPLIVERRERLDELCGIIADLACFESFSKSSFPIIPGYLITGELGRGGMGIVYRAEEENSPSERTVAIKVLPHGRFASEDQLVRFRREVGLVKQLSTHTGVVQVYRNDEIDGLPFIVMEYMDGGTLRTQWKDAPQEQRAVAELVAQLARTIDDAHRQGVVHRDLKPSNVLVTAYGQHKVGDFGLAKSLLDGGDLTETGMPIGTPEYMSPEQLLGKADERSDVYGLGALLYQGLTGRPPFAADSRPRLFEKIEQSDPAPPCQLQPGVHRDLQAVCLKCLEKSPAKRYASARELADDLSRFLAGRPVIARPINAVQRAWRWRQRNPRLSAALALAASLLIAVAVISTGWAVSLKHERDQVQLEKDRADGNLEIARGALKTVSDALAGDRRFRESPELRDLHVHLLQAEIPFWESMLRQKSDDSQLKGELGRTYWRLIATYEDIASRQEYPESRITRDKALEFADRMHGIFDEIVSQNRDDPEGRFFLGWSLWWKANVLLHLGGRQGEAERACDRAIAILENLVHEHPNIAVASGKLGACFELRGELAQEAGQFDAAKQCYRRAAALLTVPVNDSDAEGDRDFWFRRAQSKAMELSADVPPISIFRTQVDRKPDDPSLWYAWAVASVVAGDDAGYRKVCTEMIGRFGTTNDAHIAERVVYTCVVLPDAVPDTKRLVDLATTTLKLWEGNVRVVGAAMYRAGDHSGAKAAFNKKPDGRRAWDWLFLAMAFQHLGEFDEAKRCLGEGVTWIEKAQSNDAAHTWSWTERAESLSLRSEAEKLILEGH